MVPDAALSKLCPTGFFSADLCEYLDDFGGKVCNDFNANVLLETVVVKLHERALERLMVLCISIFSSIIKCKMQINRGKKLF